MNDERKVISTNIRFNLAKSEDREAWEHLEAVFTKLHRYVMIQEKAKAV